MLTLIAFLVTIGILVTVHEYGHYQVARWCGVKVLKFSIGFGKPIWSKRFGADQTEFAVAAIPLGGYVKMHGEGLIVAQSQSEEDAHRAFNRQSVYKRMAIVLAGPFANFLLAIVLYWALFLSGTVGLKPYVGNITPGSPAAIGGIQHGMKILKINGQDIESWQDARWVLLNDTIERPYIDMEAESDAGEISLHRLLLPQPVQDNPDVDVLEKLGLTIDEPTIPARIGELLKDGPAMQAGLKEGDLVTSLNGLSVLDWEQFVREIKKNPNQMIEIKVLRERFPLTLSIKPEAIEENGKLIGRIGAGVKVEQSEIEDYLVTQHYDVLAAFGKSLDKTLETAVISLKMLGHMVMGNVSWKSMSGPVSIASYAGQSAQMGLKVFVGFLALVSVSIGVLNLLPIPVLDGGHFMYYIVEFITGKPVSELAVNLGQKIGFILLIFTMLLALYNDLNRLIAG